MGVCTYKRDMTICLPKLGKSLARHVNSTATASFDRHYLKMAKHVAGFSNRRIKVNVGSVSRYS